MDIDRIVKESKTTTITEARETIFFRPRDSSRKPPSPSAVESSSVKRLSIMDSETDERREAEPRTSLAIPIESVDSAPKITVAESDAVDDLLSGYQNLEKELEDINEKKNELRKKFFEDKKETPILSSSLTAVPVSSSSSAAPTSSTRIQEWKTSSPKPAESFSKEKKKCSFADSPTEKIEEASTALVRLSPETSKRSTCPYNLIK
uniref:Uncharacterized protein n=1 Tax=Haemonchus contortus TaxID=6289 RepID=A0A7I4YW07_HAECO